MRRRALAAGTAAALLAAGCLLTIDDGRLPRAGAPVGDGGAGPPDGEVVPGSDGGATTPDGGAETCATIDASLCVDFDREALPARWDAIPNVTPTRIFELTDASFTSPPYSARIAIRREQSGEPFFHVVDWSRPAPTRKLGIELRVRIEELDGTCSGLVRIAIGDNRLDVPIGTQIGCDAQEDAAGSFQDIPVKGSAKLGVWTKVAIAVELATTPHVTLAFDGIEVASRDLGASWKTVAARDGLALLLGLQYISPPEGPKSILLDDVRVFAE